MTCVDDEFRDPKLMKNIMLWTEHEAFVHQKNILRNITMDLLVLLCNGGLTHIAC